MPEIPTHDPAAPAGEAGRAFPALVLASLTCGTVLCEQGFSPMHEAAEHVLGHPVWSHEFADHEVNKRIREAIRAHHPGLPFDKPDDWRATRDEVLARFPDPLVMPRGTNERAEGPLASLVRMVGGR